MSDQAVSKGKPAISGGRPPSPCVDVCTLDDANVCRGCGRTLDEIARWSQMDAAEQWQVVVRLRQARQG
jgi:uncharacterized protein